MLLCATLPSTLTPQFPKSVQPLCLLSRVKWDHVTQLPGRGLLCLGEVLSCAPHGNPLGLIAGRVIGQNVALKKQPPGHAHKIPTWLADTEPGGRQHTSQLHHPSLYVAQVPALAWGVGCCRRQQADQFIPGLPCGLALSQIVKVRYDIGKGTFIPLPRDGWWQIIPAASHICFDHLCTGYFQKSVH